MIAQGVLLAALAALSVAQYGGSPYEYGKPDEYKYPPQPYNFGYDTNDDYGTTQFRKESGDGSGRVQGSYGYKDNKGIERIVEYVADEKGYRAQVKTNEPGTEDKDPADVQLIANPIVIDYVPQKYAAPQPAYSVPRPAYIAAGPLYSAPRKYY